MDTPKPQRLKITPKLVLQITFPLLLFTLIPIQLAKYNTPFKKSQSTNPNPNPNPNPTNIEHHSPLPSSRRSKCDLSSGEWIPNPDAPYYTNKTCWAIHEHQNCMKYGRPDSEFMKWRWKPDDCELPLFNPNQFFDIVRGKSLAFVGDSVARNHMQSLICLLSRVEYPIDASYTKDEHFKRWYYKSYNFTLASFWSPFLVNAQDNDPNGGPSGTGLFGLRLDEADEAWKAQIDDFDYVVLSTGTWFYKPLIYYEKQRVIGCRFCQIPDVTEYSITYGFQKALQTAFKAVLERKKFKGIVYLRTYAPSHFEGGEWNKGGNCLRTQPYKSNEMNLQGVDLDLYMAQLVEFKKAQDQARKSGFKFRLIDTTQPTLLRPDGHPTRYGHWAHENVTLYNDCVHWCLPGPIDTWSDFLLEMLRTEGVIARQEEKLLYLKERKLKLG